MEVGPAREIIWGDNPDFEILEERQTGSSRWSIHYRTILKRKDGKFFEVKYSKGATECQEERPFEYTKAEFTEVFPVEKVITVYE